MAPHLGGGSCPPYFDALSLRRYALLRYGGLSLMEPRIQYAKTKDGVSCTAGDPLIVPSRSLPGSGARNGSADY